MTTQNYTKKLIPAAKAAGRGDDIAIIGPQFIRTYTQGLPIVDELDVPTGKELDLKGAHADDFVHTSRWIDGDESYLSGFTADNGDSIPRRPFSLSSYQIFDKMLAKAVELYPNAKRIVITGHSAGGQFVERYVMAATIPAGFPEENVLFAPVNPSSSTYFDKYRPESPVTWPIKFTTPTSDDCDGGLLQGGSVDPSNFDIYNKYKYALVDENADGFADGMDGKCSDCETYNYLKTIPISTLKANYERRKKMRMISLNDKDPDEASIAQTCPNHVQGDHRLARAEAFMQHLINTFGWDHWARYETLYVPGCAHSGTCVWTSTCGRYVLFGANAGSCADKDAISDKFDDAKLSQWTKSGTGSVSRADNRRAKGPFSAKFLGAGSDLTLTSPVIAGAGTYTASWAWWIGSRFDIGDSIVAEMSVDGGPWTEIDRLDGDVHPENAWLYTGTTVHVATSLRLRFVVNADGADEEAHLDDVRVMLRKGL